MDVLLHFDMISSDAGSPLSSIITVITVITGIQAEYNCCPLRGSKSETFQTCLLNQQLKYLMRKD